jgi:hypothetical protein
MQKLLLGIGLACVCGAGAFAGTFKSITIDGDTSDWVGVAPAYTDEDGVNNPSGVDFQNVYLANDANYLYIRYTLKQPADPFQGYPNETYIWLDNDTNPATGYHPFGNTLFGSSLMIISDQAYQEAGGGFNEGTLTNANVAYGALTVPGTDFEFRISRSVTGVAGAFTGVSLLTNNTIEVQLGSSTGNGDSLPSWTNYGILSYTFAASPAILTTNLPLVTLTNTSWQVNQSGTDLGTAWLDQAYDDTLSPWSSGNGLFGYTPVPGVYPTIQTALTSSGQNTYYFRTHFSWNNQADNIAFVVTNYLSDGAVYYVNGVEARRVRMPTGTIGFATSAASTNSPAGQPDVFGISAGLLLIGDNLLEVETHQEATSSADMVFGMSLTAAAQLPLVNANTNLPANQVAQIAQFASFTSDVVGSGPLTYQWFKNGAPIAGGTNASLIFYSVSAGDAGSYALSVSNSFGTNLTRTASLAVLLDTIPPAVRAVVASANLITVTFSEPLDAASANNAAYYVLSGGAAVASAVINPSDSRQVTLTTAAPLTFGTVYALTINGVADIYSNAAQTTVSFTRTITIDGAMDDWAGLTPVYSSDAPSGNTNAADFKDIYVCNDTNYYYFRVTLWADIDPGSGQFPAYANLFFDTDNNAGTGYAAFGSDMLVQSGYSYQQKDGGIANGFVDGYGINGLDWLCLPQAPGTNFEFRLLRTATFGEDGTPVFSANAINFLFQGMNTSFAVQNQAPASGVMSYTNVIPPSVAPLPLGKLAVTALAARQAAIVWDPPGTLQESSSLTGPWTNLPSATSPNVITVSGGNQFFRLTQ